MHATVRSYAADGGLVDALVANKDEARDLLTGIAGFRAYYILRTADGGAVSMSVYDDASGTDASNAAAAGWVGTTFQALRRRRERRKQEKSRSRSRGIVRGGETVRSRSPLSSVMRRSRTPGQVRLTC